MNKQDFDQRFHSYAGGSDDRRLHCGSYDNNRDFAMAVVAVINFHDGELFNWTAYWGGTDLTQEEEDAVRYIARHGNEMSRDDARHFFTSFPMTHYRT